MLVKTSDLMHTFDLKNPCFFQNRFVFSQNIFQDRVKRIFIGAYSGYQLYIFEKPSLTSLKSLGKLGMIDVSSVPNGKNQIQSCLQNLI